MENKKNFEYEEEIMKFWEDNQIFDKVNEKNKHGKPFSWVEGPPYPTGEAHLGHLRNWAIKDSVFRFERFKGTDVYVKDGYDVHGLPVEQKVQEKLGIKTVDELKEFGEEKFVLECKDYIAKIINEMKTIRKRYGLSIGDKHYQTSHPQYLSFAWRFFKKAHEKGFLYKDYRTVAWSPACECTLSDYEIKDSYKELNDPSIYVRFKIRPEFTSTKHDEYLLIWTTTPWTLESNMAIAINPKFEYSKVLVQDGGDENKFVLVIATNLVDQVIEKLQKSRDIKLLEIMQTFKGEKLIGIKYEHIYADEHPAQIEFTKKSREDKNSKIHSVLPADFVSLGEGEDIFDKLEKKSFKH
jgi:isoleucyl-tRNA synthetase